MNSKPVPQKPCYSMDKWVLCNLLLAKFSTPSKMLVVSSNTIRFSKEPLT